LAVTNTNGKFSSSRMTADVGTSTPDRVLPAAMSTRTNMSRRRMPLSFGASTRTETALDAGSTSAAT